MKVMGTATTTSLPFISSSVESEVSADLLLSAVRPLIALFVLPDLRLWLVEVVLRSSMLPICVAISPESTCGSMELLSLAGSLPTRRPSICWVRMSVSPFSSTTQTVASHWEVLLPMSGTR